MSKAILGWLGGPGVGESSKAIALAALGKMPMNPSYPLDADDFGRCLRLLELCPEARRGLEKLAKDGGPVWAVLVPRWGEIRAAYLHDLALNVVGGREAKDHRCYELIKSIIRPAERALPNRPVHIGDVSFHFRK